MIPHIPIIAHPYCRTTPSSTVLLINGNYPLTWRLSQYKYQVHKNTSSDDLTCHQYTVTVESWQSTQGGLAQQAGTSYTRRASRDSSCFELTLSHPQQCKHSPVTVCCVSVCASEPGAVAPTGRDWVWAASGVQIFHTL